MKYADFGCGGIGHFVLPASRIVGKDGGAYAVDILKKALAGVESRAKMQGASNIHCIWGDIQRPGGVAIESDALDFISMVNLAQVFHAEHALEEARRIARPGGSLFIIDWEPKAAFCPVSYRPMPSSKTRRYAERQGFVFDDMFRAGPCHYGLLLHRAK